MPMVDGIAIANRIYKDIISFRISNNGELIWAKNIIKRQNAMLLNNVPFLSYTATVKNDISYYFVNANEDLKELKNDRIKFTESSKLYILKMLENGDFQYDLPLYSNIFNAKPALRFELLLNNSDILMQAESNNRPLLVKLYF